MCRYLGVPACAANIHTRVRIFVYTFMCVCVYMYRDMHTYTCWLQGLKFSVEGQELWL